MVEILINKLPQLDFQISEAINTLCTNLSLAGGDIKKILITSCHPREGKSFMSMTLFQALTELGKKVLLIDADIRGSKLNTSYDIQVYAEGNYRGLTGYLAGLTGMDEIIGETNIPGGHMILSGRTVVNSFQLFNSPRFDELLRTVTPEYDLILIDSPPIGTIIDAAKVALYCDGALFVVESNSIHIGQLKNAVAQIEKTGCRIIGYVINKIDHRKNKSDYYYYYGYSYGDHGKQKKRNRIGKR